MRIAGKHAVVTGGSRGIGLAVAQRLVQEGARVSIVSRSPAVDAGESFIHATADV